MRKSKSSSRKKVLELESRVHRKVQALVRGGAAGKGPQGTSLTAYSTISTNGSLRGFRHTRHRT